MTDQPAEKPSILSEDDGRTRVWVLLLATVLIVWCVAIYAYIFIAVPAFDELFRGFGADLPLLTAMVINYSWIALLLALVSLVPLASVWRNRASAFDTIARDLTTVVIAFAVSIVVGSTAVWGLYLPIFQMGAVV